MEHTVTLEKPITLLQLKRMIYPIPKSWKKAAGMLRHHQNALERHIAQVRNEWDKNSSRV